MTIREDWPFGKLRPLSYDLIMADPPWPTSLRSRKGYRKAPEQHYATMPIPDIAALPVGELASKDCILFLWGMWSLVYPSKFSEATIGDVIKGWGFNYCTGGPWLKRTRTGKLTFGTGYRARGCNEPFFICTIGEPKTSRSHRNIIDAVRRAHSQKPIEAYQWCETFYPGARRLDLFAGDPRKGWDRWAPLDHRPRNALPLKKQKGDADGRPGMADQKGQAVSKKSARHNRQGRRESCAVD